MHPHLVIKHSTRARRLALRLDPAERVVRLTVPRGISLKKAQDFVYDHMDWIDEKIAALPPAMPYEHGRTIPLLGQDRLLEIIEPVRGSRTKIELLPDSLHVQTLLENPSARIERFIKNLALENLTALSHEKAALIDKKIKAVTVRDTKSRWGSCAHDGALSYSWRLIFAPRLAMDYVVAHEIAHLVHLNHSRAFWDVCRDLSEDYVEGEYWMRNHGHELMRYGVSDPGEIIQRAL
ncbi:MAG: M48 family metallopeptidase [Alphaproteobacteria bacterium]|nr:M48 family metallopeptidase [Alphaproteobacteria bacterium]MCD8571559.1 M48 family metallopeptidase [Alphaproteobacteria bacterium]